MTIRCPRATLIGTACLLYAGAVAAAMADGAPYLVVLGTAQDGGAPQLGNDHHPGSQRDAGQAHHAAALGLADPESGTRWLFEATPDIRAQMRRFERQAPRREGGAYLDGIFLSHAHIGHYTGLMFLGHESMGARVIPVHAMPRMAEFLRGNGPWSQLVDFGNIALEPLQHGRATVLNPRLRVTPFRVPHRDEYSETVGFRIQGPARSALFLPDIDSWAAWEAAGSRLERQIEQVDVAYLDGTFFADGEIPGRDMSGFPHPRIRDTVLRLQDLPAAERRKVRFIHLNHTNPALRPDSDESRWVVEHGLAIARPGERQPL